MKSTPFVPSRIKKNFHVKLLFRRVEQRYERKKHTPGYAYSSTDFINDVDPQSITHNLGGKRMKLKYEERENVKVGQGPKKYPMIQIKGTVVGGDKDGDTRTIRFFPSEKDMHETVKNANAGDILDITMKQNGKFWNPVAMHNDTQDGAEAGSGGPSLQDFQKTQPQQAAAAPVQTFSREEAVRCAAVEHITKLSAYKDATKLDVTSMLYDADQIAEYVLKGIPEDSPDLPEIDYETDKDDDDS